jgi:hypothetical protein
MSTKDWFLDTSASWLAPHPSEWNAHNVCILNVCMYNVCNVCDWFYIRQATFVACFWIGGILQ